MEKKISDDALIANWTDLLSQFHAINPDAKNSKAEYNALIERARITPLTTRQQEGIIARCKNSLNGTYGNTKSPEHYQQGKPSSKNG